MIDLSKLSNSELMQLSDELPIEIKARIADLSALTLLQEKRSGDTPRYRRAPKTYQNPADPRKTWGGIGKRPNWLKAMVAKGIPAERLVVGGAKAL